MDNPTERAYKPTDRAPDRSMGPFLSIFLGILAVAPFVIVVTSPAGRFGLLAVALALAGVIHEAIPLWHQQATRRFLAAVVILLAGAGGYVWLALPRVGEDDRLRAQVTQLEAGKAALEQENAAMAQQLGPFVGARSLLSFVGKRFEDTCKVVVDDGYFVGEESSIECAPQGMDGFGMALFPDNEKLSEAYNTAVRGVEVTLADGISDCGTNKPSEGEWQTYSEVRPRTVGRLLCYFDRQRALILWTHNDLKIYAYAIRNDGNMSALFEWWIINWASKP